MINNYKLKKKDIINNLEMQLVQKHIIKRTDVRYKDLINLCHLSKNLYNVVLYTIRQHWFQTVHDDTVKHKFLNYYNVWQKLTTEHNVDYYALQYHSAQLVIKQVEANFSSFFSLLKLKKQGKYDKKVHLPKYLDKDGYNIISFNQFKKKQLKDGYVTLPKTKLRFKIKHTNLHFINVVPQNDYVVVNMIYKQEEVQLKEDNKKYMSIDLGVSNLATVTSNVFKAFIIDGKPIKHINQFYNKKYAEAKSQLQLKNGRKYSHRTRQLTLKRNNKINDYFHKVSHYLINQAVSNDVQTIIVGHNKDWKQEINNGKVNNQNFVFIPFDKLISQLKYKGKLQGINVVQVQQSYTSKCSSFDNEQLKHHDPYLGKRVKRGLFKTVRGKLINADVNGSLNIMRKYCKCNCDVIFKYNNQQMQGLVLNPIKIKF